MARGYEAERQRCSRSLMPNHIAQPHHIPFEPLCIYEMNRDDSLRRLPGRARRQRQVWSSEDAALRLASYQAGIYEKAYLIYQALAEEQPVQCASRIHSHHLDAVA